MNKDKEGGAVNHLDLLLDGHILKPSSSSSSSSGRRRRRRRRRREEEGGGEIRVLSCWTIMVLINHWHCYY